MNLHIQRFTKSCFYWILLLCYIGILETSDTARQAYFKYTLNMLKPLLEAFSSKETIRRAAPILIFSFVLSVVLIIFAVSFRERDYTEIVPVKNYQESNRPVPPGDYKVKY